MALSNLDSSGDIQIFRNRWKDSTTSLSIMECESVLTLSRPKILLHCHHVYPMENLDVHKTFDPRLSRSFKISSDSILEAGIKQFDHLIVNLDLSLKIPEIIPELEQVFRFRLPNLKSFTLENSQVIVKDDISYDDTFAQLDSFPPDFCLTHELGCGYLWRPRPALKKITVKCLHETASHFFLQRLIDSAPNIETLQIIAGFGYGNVYPDLRGKKKLRSLLYSGDMTGDDLFGTSDFDVTNFNRMLKEVAGWLEELELNAVGTADIEHGYFQMPVMPNLILFCNKRLDVFPCGDGLTDIFQTFPRLEHLSYPYSNEGLIDNIETLSWGLWEEETGSFGRVKSLRIPVVSRILEIGSCGQYLSQLKLMLPSLETLTLDLGHTFGRPSQPQDPMDHLIPEVLNVARYLGLNHLEITIMFNIMFRHLVQLLSKNCSGLEYLQSLTIHFEIEFGAENWHGTFPPEYLEPLKALIGMNRVEFSGFKVSNKSELSKQMVSTFASEHKIPIYFLN